MRENVGYGLVKMFPLVMKCKLSTCQKENKTDRLLLEAALSKSERYSGLLLEAALSKSEKYSGL